MTGHLDLPDVAQLLADRTAAAIVIDDLNSALGLVVQAAVDGGLCEEASITQRRRDGTLETAAPTGELVVMADKLQYELGEGPCVRAIYQDGLLSCPDVATDPRWSWWGPAAADLGIGGVISAYLHDDGRPLRR